MLKSLEDISATRKRLNIEIPSEAIEKEISASLGALRSRTRLPGFRQGKVPVALLQKRYGKEVQAEALEKVIPEYYSEALKEAELTPVRNPEFEGGVDYKKDTPLKLTLTVEVRPRVEGLDYKGLSVADIPVEIKEEDVDATLEKLRSDKASYEPTEGPVEDGFLVVMDYEVKDGGSYRDEVFKVGSGTMPEGFSENLIGLRKSEEKEFSVSMPEDFRNPELAGKDSTFKVTVKEIKDVVLPEMDDEFAKDLEFDDMAALREHVKERLDQSHRGHARKMQKAEALKKLLDKHPFEAPESLVREELDHMTVQAKAQGVPEPDEKQYAEAAERQVRAALLLQMIAEEEGLEAGEQDIRQRIEEVSAQSGLSPENVVKYYVSRDGSLEGLRNSVLEDKVLEFLLEKATIEKAETSK